MVLEEMDKVREKIKILTQKLPTAGSFHAQYISLLLEKRKEQKRLYRGIIRLIFLIIKTIH
ncbi:hypothetical protein PP175_25215 (plasmid) [Aneurinibacillus sp. Ricciae_BoGa-3]|uniref:hypothetical protein n=1 Tax=Aneurinibacillus sp. Ricciae_BoGa-3 TaxID=3022697 RepID=UPI002340C3FC|nr:hypothetical protein [Aneurinibacillus sp. Ricciae_BoGa-3]WCK57369.1 hypothetical protein PP175_25215 [Aneurinibacillus sp. Ricciae_BoGa-3]